VYRGQLLYRTPIYLTEIYSAGDGSRTYTISYSLMGIKKSLDTFQVVVRPQRLQIIQTVELPVHRITSKHATCQLKKMMPLLLEDLKDVLSLLRSGARLIWRSSSGQKVNLSTQRMLTSTISRARQVSIRADFQRSIGGRTSCTSKKSG